MNVRKGIISVYSITPGMSRVFSRKSKKSCPVCGLAVPVYPGRYPKTCPNCRALFPAPEENSKMMEDFVVDEVLEMLIKEEISLGRAIDRIDEESEQELDDEFKSQSDRKTLTLDRFMQLVTMARLLDALIGVKIQGVSSNIWAYFSDAIPENKMKDFLDKVKSFAQDAKLYPSNEEGSKWVVSVLNFVRDKEPEISGNVDSEVSIAGNTDVIAPQ